MYELIAGRTIVCWLALCCGMELVQQFVRNNVCWNMLFVCLWQQKTGHTAVFFAIRACDIFRCCEFRVVANCVICVGEKTLCALGQRKHTGAFTGNATAQLSCQKLLGETLHVMAPRLGDQTRVATTSPQTTVLAVVCVRCKLMFIICIAVHVRRRIGGVQVQQHLCQ